MEIKLLKSTIILFVPAYTYPTGLLDNREATSHKPAFSWMRTQGTDIIWDERARWKVDGKYYSSSGVSARMYMSFGFLADRHGVEFSRSIAKQIEYNWEEDSENDAFTEL